MPLDTNACVDVVDAMCNTIYAYAEHLRCEAMHALDQCFVGGSCRDSIRSYLSLGAGDDGIADSLIVVAGQMVLTAGTVSVGPSMWRAPFDIRLRESGYPMAGAADGGRSIAAPDPDAQHRATMLMMSHGEAIHRRMSALKASGSLAPEGYRCSRGLITGSGPLAPQGGVAGWTVSLQIDLAWG